MQNFGVVCLVISFLVLALVGPSHQSSMETKTKVKPRKCKRPNGFAGQTATCSKAGRWVVEKNDFVLTIKETVEDNNKMIKEILNQTPGDCEITAWGLDYAQAHIDQGWQTGSMKASNVLTNEKDNWICKNFTSSNPPFDCPISTRFTNFWILPGGVTGPFASLYLNLGCMRVVKGFMIKNTHNGLVRNAGTENFKIYISDTQDGEYKEVLNGTLSDARKVKVVPVEKFMLTQPFPSAKFIKFQVESFYQGSGGLQYFSIYE